MATTERVRAERGAGDRSGDGHGRTARNPTDLSRTDPSRTDLSRTDLSRTEQALLEALRGRILGGRADGALEHGADVELLADRMVAALPTVKHEADALIGPFYDTPTLAAWRGVTRQALSKATAKRDLIGLKIGDGSLVFPSFQFGVSGTPLPNLRQVLALIDPDRIDPWGSALWLNTEADEFGGTTAAQALRDGRDEQVLAAARRAAHAWAADA